VGFFAEERDGAEILGNRLTEWPMTCVDEAIKDPHQARVSVRR